MRVKFKSNDKRPKLEFGKTYDVTLFGCSFWWRVKFTKGKNLIVEAVSTGEVSGEIVTRFFDKFKVSKKEFKRYLKDDIVVYVSEYQPKRP